MSKKERKVISLDDKRKILERRKAGEKAINIASSMGLPPTTIRTICKRDILKIQESVANISSSFSKKVTRSRQPIIERMESLLLIWIEDKNQRRLPLSQLIITNKAKSLFETLKSIPDNNPGPSSIKFEASRGWFQRFKARAELHNVALKGEAASADVLGAKLFQDEFEKSVINDYSIQQIMNVDETGLCWKRMPARTFISKQQISAPGHKVAKERLTLLLGGNAAGDFKFKPFLIYISANPRAMKNINKEKLNVHWRSNKKAWMTASMFYDWVKNCCIPELKEYS